MAVLALLLLLAPLDAALGAPLKRPAVRSRPLVLGAGPTAEPIADSGLLEPACSAANVVERGRQYNVAVNERHLTTPVLAYVTPWNPRGYELAVQFRGKLTHVSPVWYQLRREEESWLLAGSHEHNATWIDAVRAPTGDAGECAADAAPPDGGCKAVAGPKLVPRVVVELTTGQDHLDMVQEPEEVVELLGKLVEANGYDGLVLEVWQTWVGMNGMSNEGFRGQAQAFIKALHARLKQGGASNELILVIPPLLPSNHKRPYTNPWHMQMTPHVDGWSVMLYDFSGGMGPQPNAPIYWLQDNLKLLLEDEDAAPMASMPEKVFVGMNFYGYDYVQGEEEPSAITSDAYLDVLQQHQPHLDWREREAEHRHTYTVGDQRHTTYYPSALSVARRLDLFREKGVGVAIWELGQGLERWMDLF